MPISLERTFIYRKYPLSRSAFLDIADCLRTEYRKAVPVEKDILDDDFEDSSLRDFVEDRNPPLSLRFSVRQDDFQTVLSAGEFETLADNPFSYDQIAVILLLDVDGSLLSFTARLDGSLSLMLRECRTLTGEQASALLNRISRNIRRLLHQKRTSAERQITCDPEEDQSENDIRKRKMLSVIRKTLKWTAATVIAGIIGEIIHENFGAMSEWFLQTIA